MRLPGGMRYLHRLLAFVLVLSCALGPLPLTTVLAEEEGHAGIRGLLYESDADTRLPAARVIAINVTTGERFESNLTGSNGAFEVKGMPSGTYDIVIESGGQLFVVDNLVDLARGQRITVSFSVEPRKPANRRIEGLVDPSGTALFVGLPPGTGPVGAGGSALKTPGGIVSLIVLTIGAAIVIDSALDDDKPTSPIVP